MKKCGEIMLSNKTKFIFVCAFCNEEFKEMLSFGKHVHQDHLKLDNNEFEDIKEKTAKSSLDSIKLGKETQSGSIISTLSQNLEVVDSDNKAIDPELVEIQNELNYGQLEAIYLPTSSEHQNNTHSDNFIPITPKKQDQHADLRNETNRIFHTQSSTSNNKDAIIKTFGNDVFKCEDCDREFKTRPQLVQHTRIHTGRKNHICPHCSKRFIVKQELVRHIRTHTGERPFKCTFCPKGFIDKTGLNIHIRRHLGEKRYACDFCEKRFVHSTDKKVHMRSHTGEKPYQCDECGSNYTTSSTLVAHKRLHSNTRNHKCEVCGKEFLRSYDLKKHSIVHSNERPFQCEICLVTYPRRGTLREHMKIHSDVKEYVCDICSKAFAQQPGLYSHMKSHGVKLGQTMKAG